jgi:stage II sporulation SpoE-like protein
VRFRQVFAVTACFALTAWSVQFWAICAPPAAPAAGTERRSIRRSPLSGQGRRRSGCSVVAVEAHELQQAWLNRALDSSAGHLPPIIGRPGQRAAAADVASDLLMGVSAVRHRQVSILGFRPGAVLCLYTDGLVEPRDQPIDDGIAQLRAAVTATGHPEAGCAAVMPAMADYSTHNDDVALLMIHRAPGKAGTGSADSPCRPHTPAPRPGPDRAGLSRCPAIARHPPGHT